MATHRSRPTSFQRHIITASLPLMLLPASSPASQALHLRSCWMFFVPRGWFLPVTPGTKFITVGGAVASDVHGKNHHSEGAFSNHILSMEVYTPAFGPMTCSPAENPDLFWATCGGMGLTGVILQVTFGLKKIESAYIQQKQIKASDLNEILNYLKRTSRIPIPWHGLTVLKRASILAGVF